MAEENQPTVDPADPRRRSRRSVALALLFATASAIVWTHPLVTRMDDSITTIVPESAPACADQILSVWIVVEAGRRLYDDPIHVFDANVFHPMRHALAYSESMLAAAAIVGPLHAVLDNPILAFNLYYLATLVLSFLGVFFLVREITHDPRAALLSGLLFAFVGDRWRIPDHLPAQSVHCIPWVFYFWLRSLSAPSWSNRLGLGLAMAANFLHSVYYGLALPVLVLPWAAVLLAARRWPLGRWVTSGAILVVASLVSLAAYLPYLAVGAETDYRPILLGGIPAHWYWDGFAHPLAYLQSLFDNERRPIAASPIAWAVLAVAYAVRRRRPRRPAPRDERLHGLAMLAFFLGAVLLSLGPSIDVGVRVPGPFRLLARLPGFSSFRGTSRLLIVAAFAAIVLGGIGMAALLRRMRTRVGVVAVTAMLAIVVAIDTRAFAGPWPLSRLLPEDGVPPVYEWLSSTPPGTAILELPYGSWGDDARAMLFSTYHGRRIMNGYSARTPYFGEVLLRFPAPIAVRALQDAGVSYVLAHRDRLETDPAASRRLARMARRTELSPRWIGGTLVLTIPPAAPTSIDPVGRRLDFRKWRVVGSTPGAEHAADGDLQTHWLTRIAERDSFLRVDLGARRRLTGVVLRMGPHFLEYPRRYGLWVSDDGSSWRPAGRSEPATLPPFASYRRDHLDVRVPLSLTPVDARYLAIRVPGRPKRTLRRPERAAVLTKMIYELRDPDAFLESRWGVHEIDIYEAPRQGPRPAASRPTRSE